MRLRDALSVGELEKSDWETTDGSGQLRSLQVVGNKNLDPLKMSASALINTDAVDYENAVIYADGVRTDNYARNPIVLWEHGLNPNVPLPIGSAEDDGVLHLSKSEFEIEAKTFFSQTNPFASQVFGLVDEGVVRATSIQVVPSRKSKLKMADGRTVKVTEESDMAEFSWCCLGVNPEAIRRSRSIDNYREAWFLQVDAAVGVLERGRIGEDQLLPEIKSSLASLIPDAKASSPGFNFDTETEMKKITPDAVAKMSREELKAIVDSEEKMADYDEASKAILKNACRKSMADEDDDHDHDHDDEAGDEGDVKDDGGPKDGDHDEPEKKSVNVGEMKPGARELVRLHRGLTLLTDTFKKRFDEELDRTPITKSVLSILDAVADERAAIEGAFAEQYPDYPEIAGDDGESGVDDEFEREMKSLLSGDQRSAFKTEGIIGRLSRVSDSKSLGDEDRGHLQLACRALERISTDAKSFVPPAPEGMITQADHDAAIAAEVSKREEVEATLAELDQFVKSEVLPAT